MSTTCWPTCLFVFVCAIQFRMAALSGTLRILPETLLKCPRTGYDSKRTAVILRRLKPVRLNKLGETFMKRLRRSEYYYEVVKITDTEKQPLLDLVLIKDVPGVGMTGEKITVNRYISYSELILPKLAVYADSEEAKNIVRKEEEIQVTSKYSKIVENYLASRMVPVYMSPLNEWTLKPLHIKVGLRRIGIIASEECISSPLREISGPDPELENKDFIIKLTMNKFDVFKIRCRIFYWLGGKSNPDEFEESLEPTGVLFPEEKEEIEKMINIQKEIKAKEQLIGRKLISSKK